MNNQGQALTRWSRDYEKCLGCGTTTIQHWGKGYCNRCYPKYIVRKTGEFDRSNEEFYAEYKRKVNAKISEAQKIKMNSPRIVNQLNEHLLKELYCKDRLSLGDIAKRFNCSRVYILRLCNKYGVTVRTKSQARKVAYSIGKKLRYHNIDTNFFKQWTPEMAYVLGFIYADGCIDRRLTYFSISQREVEILGKIRTLLKAEQNILHRKSQDLYDLVIGSKEMVADLLKLGVVPQKSLMIKFPQMPKEFISHLISALLQKLLIFVNTRSLRKCLLCTVQDLTKNSQPPLIKEINETARTCEFFPLGRQILH